MCISVYADLEDDASSRNAGIVHNYIFAINIIYDIVVDIHLSVAPILN